MKKLITALHSTGSAIYSLYTTNLDGDIRYGILAASSVLSAITDPVPAGKT